MNYTYSFELFKSLAVDPNDPRVAYAGAAGISKTVNAGQTWTSLPGILDNLTVVRW